MTGSDLRTASLEAVREAYAGRALEYIALVGTAATGPDGDRDLIADWASRVEGPVLDAGCGPGQWSAFLHERGIGVEGVDATPAFVAHAQRTVPGVPFRVGDLRRLELAPGSLGGVLAWFSLIHLDPADVPGVLARLAAALRPGGSLLLGFFTGPALEPFDHSVVTAWAWPQQELGRVVEAAGLEVVATGARPQPSGRIWAHLVARRRTEAPGG